jgi:hypothetical protein
MFRRSSFFAILAMLILSLNGCATIDPPVTEYTLARAALEAARIVDAPRFSPGFWHQAEESFRRARVLFEEREFRAAKVEFTRAKISAEKAENSARLIRIKTGEVL